MCVCVQSCTTLCDTKDWGLLGSFVHGIFQARKWVSSHFLLWGIFPIQGSKSHLQHHCSGRRILHYWDTWQVNYYLKIYNATNTIRLNLQGLYISRMQTIKLYLYFRLQHLQNDKWKFKWLKVTIHGHNLCRILYIP